MALTWGSIKSDMVAIARDLRQAEAAVNAAISQRKQADAAYDAAVKQRVAAVIALDELLAELKEMALGDTES